MPHHVTAAGVDPDGGVVGAGGVGHEDQAVAGVEAVDHVHPPSEHGPIDSAVERIHVWRERRGDHASPGWGLTRGKVEAEGALVKTAAAAGVRS
jgi:hypothetical protein